MSKEQMMSQIEPASTTLSLNLLANTLGQLLQCRLVARLLLLGEPLFAQDTAIARPLDALSIAAHGVVHTVQAIRPARSEEQGVRRILDVSRTDQQRETQRLHGI